MARLLVLFLSVLTPAALGLSIWPWASNNDNALRPAPVLPVPTRPLQWGDVNFLSTSDTHGDYHSPVTITDAKVGYADTSTYVLILLGGK